MTIVLNNKENVYEQIVTHYKKYIELGFYQVDDRLPSCRELASELGINPNTVSKAYQKLEEDGFIIAIPKKGIYVKAKDNKNDDYLKKEIEDLKSKGVSFEELMEAIREVYKK